MIKRVICVFVLLVACSIFGQNYDKHTVKNGETIIQIAQKYRVTPHDIYQLNPDAQGGLNPDTILLIPKKADSQKTSSLNKTHTVEPKETLYGIEKLYDVSDEDLKKANPFLESEGLQIGQTLIIPSNTAPNTASKINVTKQDNVVYHEVLPRETKFAIAKQYGITIEELEKRNPEIIPNLPIGYKLIIKGNIPKTENKLTVETKKEIVEPIAKKVSKPINYVDYEVKPRETLYGLSKMFGLSQDELITLNPALNDGVEVGMILKVPSSTTSIKQETKKNITTEPQKKIEETTYKKNTPTEPKKVIDEPVSKKVAPIEVKKEIEEPVYKKIAPTEPKKEGGSTQMKVLKRIQLVDYEVKSKETLFSLSQLFELNQEELIALNPALKKGVEEGMILRVPLGTPNVSQETKKEYSSLSKISSSIGRKKLVLLLPFNLSKIENDTINSTSMRLKKDKFLNMTLDFYSGALMAIDSAKSLGIQMDVSILDSQETKTTSNISSLIQANNLEEADAIIGPFYQNNVEKTAELLSINNVPVISPLSKDIGNSFPNLFQTIPTNDVLRNEIFDYMKSKQGNMIAVIDKKKESVKQYIQENQKEVQFATIQENGSLLPESLKKLFVKDKTNYVILETTNTGMIKATMAAMMSVLANYKMQLVILQPNETLNTDEINFDSLIKLKLLYPSIARENDSPEALIFKKAYQNSNKISPSTFATRGFDVTFDTMMRLVQGKSYQETAETLKTKQVDNKFEYYKKTDGGYANKGVYILYYDTNLTIKEAN